MRIAHVLHRMDLAGAEVLAADLARQLQQRHTFTFLCLDGIGPLGDTLRGEGFTVECVMRRPGLDWRAARALRRLLQTHRIDLIHAHQYTPFFYAALARRGLSHAPPIVFTEHGRHVPDVVSWKRRWANRWLLRDGDHVTAVSRFVKQALIEHERIAADRIEVIPNGIDPYRFHADAATRAAVRAAWGATDDTVVLLQVARFHAVKDHATALRAFAAMARDAAAARSMLVFVGDGELRKATESLANELGVSDRVRFLGLRRDVPVLLEGADVLVLSSLSEGLPVTVLEAMAARLPVAATRVGGVPEAVEEGVTGLLSDRGDTAGLAANLRRLTDDAGLRANLGRAGRERVERFFTQTAMHRTYAAVYDRLYRTRGAGEPPRVQA
jgi:glycosyltransferase involved in cell wall biosynthesis